MFNTPCTLPSPEAYVREDRILVKADVAPVSNKPGVRATSSIWGWLGWICRLWIHYMDQEGHHCFINKVSAQKFLRRHNFDAVDGLSNRSIKRCLEGFVSVPSPLSYSDTMDKTTVPTDHALFSDSSPMDDEETFNGEIFASINGFFAKKPDEELFFTQADVGYKMYRKKNTYYVERIDTEASAANDVGAIAKVKIEHDKKGNVVSIDIEGDVDEDASSKTMDELAEDLYCCAATEAQRKHTTYEIGNTIVIEVVHDLLTTDAPYQLERFVDILSNLYKTRTYDPFPALRVNFLTNSLNYEPAIDGGGPSREFLETLAAGIAYANDTIAMQLTHDDTLSVPTTLAGYVQGTYALPKLNSNERSCLNNLGKFFYFCWNSGKSKNTNQDKHYYIGRHFDESLFSLIASFDVDELHRESCKLSQGRILELFASMAEADEDQTSQTMLSLLSTTSDHITDEQLECVGYKLAEEEYLLADGLNPDTDKIRADWDHVRAKLIDGLYEKFSGRLVAAHEVARGIKTFVECNKDRWKTTFFKTDVPELSTRIQGSIDRDAVAYSIEMKKVSTYTAEEKKVLEQKLEWLREWILDQATPDSEVKAFLRFAIGQSSLPPDKVILIIKQYGDLSPVPVAHTCSFELEFAAEYVNWSKDKKDGDTLGEYHDYDKEGFIHSLREWALGLKGFQMV